MRGGLKPLIPRKGRKGHAMRHPTKPPFEARRAKALDSAQGARGADTPPPQSQIALRLGGNAKGLAPLLLQQEPARLPRPETGIKPALRQKLIMAALFHNLALIHHHQPVHGGDG